MQRMGTEQWSMVQVTGRMRFADGKRTNYYSHTEILKQDDIEPHNYSNLLINKLWFRFIKLIDSLIAHIFKYPL